MLDSLYLGLALFLGLNLVGGLGDVDLQRHVKL